MKALIRTRLAIAVAGLGIAGAAGWAASGERETDARAFGAMLRAACLPQAARGAEHKAFFKVAQAQNELKPFGRAAETARPAPADDDPPLWEDLGSLHYPVTTASAEAQRYFDQGLRLAYAFNHAEARRAFRKAQKLDPRCAMCYWGEALVLGPNINMPMPAAAIEPARTAAARAAALAPNASAREQLLIDALTRRYAGGEAERAKLDAAYAQAMSQAAARFPEDHDIGVLYAESLMNLSPWDYWEAGGARPKGRTQEIVDLLERVIAAAPDHPGAIHYYIHMVEASTEPQRALAPARRLGSQMPAAGHLVHMPSHIYYRIGLYKDSLAANKAAVRADEAYLARARASDIYARGYYPHNVHFMLVSAQMAGDGDTVLAAADKLRQVVSREGARQIPWTQPIMAAPYFAHAQFGEPQATLALAPPEAGLPYVKAMWHYARGIAHLGLGDLAAARAESVQIGRLQGADFGELTAAGIPAPEVLQIARQVLQGRIAQAAGELPNAIAAFRAAAVLEDRLAYMEPPYWYYPVRQSLGAALFQAGDLDGAEQAFRASLARAPNNAWALYGLAQVYDARGDERAARATQRLLDEAWVGDRKLLDIARL